MSWESRVEEKIDEVLRTQAEHGARLATLEERTKSPPKKSGGISISSGAAGGAVGAILSFLAQHWSSK